MFKIHIIRAGESAAGRVLSLHTVVPGLTPIGFPRMIPKHSLVWPKNKKWAIFLHISVKNRQC